MTKKLVTVLFALLVLTLPLCALADEESSVSTPNISVTTTTGSATFTLKSDSKNAKIYYTTNGSDPTTSSTKYSKSVKVTKSCEVRAVAVESGEYSPVGYYTVTVTKARVNTPTFKSTNVEGGKKITISCSGATIYYTLDGTNPTTNSTRYTSSGVTVAESCVIKAIGVRSGYQNSAIATGTVSIQQLGKPTVTKSTSGSKTVYKLSGPSSGCTYYYTTDGSTPVAKASGGCKKYSSSGISVTKGCTIKFIACKSGYAPSKVYSVEAEGQSIPAPTAKKTGVVGGVKVTLTSSLSGVTYYYTLDGSTPTTSDAKYSSKGISITEPGTTYVGLLAVKSGYDSKTFSFSLSLSQLSKPTASLVSSSSSSTSREIKLTGPSGSTIYYTTNGKEPTTSSSKVATGKTIKVSSSCTLKMFAAKSGYANSDTVSAQLNINQKVATPTISETKYTDYNKVTIRCATSGATILYTIDGSDPLDYGEAIKSGTSIKIEESCLLKAIAIKDGYENSSKIYHQVILKGDDVTPLGLDIDTVYWDTDTENSSAPEDEVIIGGEEAGDYDSYPELSGSGIIEVTDTSADDGFDVETEVDAYTDDPDPVEPDFTYEDGAVRL